MGVSHQVSVSLRFMSRGCRYIALAGGVCAAPAGDSARHGSILSGLGEKDAGSGVVQSRMVHTVETSDRVAPYGAFMSRSRLACLILIVSESYISYRR